MGKHLCDSCRHSFVDSELINGMTYYTDQVCVKYLREVLPEIIGATECNGYGERSNTQRIPSTEIQFMRKRLADTKTAIIENQALFTFDLYTYALRLLNSYEETLGVIELKDSEYQALLKKYNEYARLIHSTEPEGRKYTNELYWKLLQDNDRLREALEDILKLTPDPNKPCRGNVSTIARKALDNA